MGCAAFKMWQIVEYNSGKQIKSQRRWIFSRFQSFLVASIKPKVVLHTHTHSVFLSDRKEKVMQNKFIYKVEKQQRT